MPSTEPSPGRPGPRRLTAFGETKTVSQWANDPRCRVSYHTLMSRAEKLKDGEGAEKILTTPAARRLTAFGETKTVAQWANDPRCRVSYSTLLSRAEKLDDGEDAEQILTSPADTSRTLTAFGETKTVAQWANDPRCRVSYPALKSRARGLKDGEDAERILTAVPHTARTLTAFGETKTIAQWAKDPRCRVSYPTLNSRAQRLKNGEDAEKILTAPAARGPQPAPPGGAERMPAQGRPCRNCGRPLPERAVNAVEHAYDCRP